MESLAIFDEVKVVKANIRWVSDENLQNAIMFIFSADKITI